MKHLDLFSGIGGFAYAADQVWDDVEHIFCDTDTFCRAVLNKHWPESEIYDDIRKIDSDPFSIGLQGGKQEEAEGQGEQLGRDWLDQAPFLLTGGFPCQSFSQAGLRRGTADDRYLWPEMFRVIRLTKPQWVIAENVRGLVTWKQGMVVEQVCTDLEAEGYEVQPFIIPACAVNAPHRRDRIWFVAHAIWPRTKRERGEASDEGRATSQDRREGIRQADGETGPSRANPTNTDATDTRSEHGNARRREELAASATLRRQGIKKAERFDLLEWGRDWTKVATKFCSVDDGLPVELDGLKLTKAQHRGKQISGYGNAIVPQVAVQIMQAIKEASLSTVDNHRK